MLNIDFADWNLTNPENKLNNEKGGVAWKNVKRSDITLMSHKNKEQEFIDFEYSFDFIVNEIKNFNTTSRVLFTLWKLKKSNGNVLSVYIDKWKGSQTEYRLVFYQRVAGENTFVIVSGGLDVGARYSVLINKKGETFSMKILWEEGTIYESGDRTGADDKYNELLLAQSHGFVVEPNCETSGLLYNLHYVEKETHTELIETPMVLYNSLITHKTIVEYTGGLFGDGYYDAAVYQAFKQIDLMVKKKTSAVLPGESGSSLMGKVFSVKNPILKINKLETDSEKNEQQGFCQIFLGSMIGIRNPVVHDNTEIGVKRALHLLSLANMLAEIVDQAELA